MLDSNKDETLNLPPYNFGFVGPSSIHPFEGMRESGNQKLEGHKVNVQ